MANIFPDFSGVVSHLLATPSASAEEVVEDLTFRNAEEAQSVEHFRLCELRPVLEFLCQRGEVDSDGVSEVCLCVAELTEAAKQLGIVVHCRTSSLELGFRVGVCLRIFKPVELTGRQGADR